MADPLVPLTGKTRTGLPLSYSVAPSADLAPFILRHFVTIIDQPEGQVTTDFILSETAFVRVLVRGYWEAEIEPGGWRHFTGPLLFGPQGRPMNVRVRGPMAVTGFALRPGGWRALFDMPASAYTDRLLSLGEVWDEAEAVGAAGSRIDDANALIRQMEAAVRGRLAARAERAVSGAMAGFEGIALRDPTRPVAGIARDLGLSLKQLQAQTLMHFGLTPKAILRRSRFLDLAATMRGIALPHDEAQAALRYYDQSHITREVRRFTGMTPAQFLRVRTPLLTLGIEARQLRKAEEGALVAQGGKAPWAL